MIVVIDNKDSFTYNLINYFKMATRDMVNVIDVEEINIEELKALKLSLFRRVLGDLVIILFYLK